MKIEIYQIKKESPNAFLAFDPNRPVNQSDYMMVFCGYVDCKTIKDVYRMFNFDFPEGYRGRSLRISDVVQVIKSNSVKPGAYYCDSFGFQRLDFMFTDSEELKSLPATLRFTYGAMGAGKSAHLLVELQQLKEKGINVWLIKPDTDTRDKTGFACSRNGQSAPCELIDKHANIYCLFDSIGSDMIIADEAQFFTERQIQELREIVNDYGIPVICYGLKTDFQTKLFEGSKALIELADEITEIDSVCRCGKKAIINARLDEMGNVITDGSRIVIGGSDKYEAMCYSCWKKHTQS